MIVKLFEKKYEELINSWWTSCGYQEVPFEVYPQNTFIIFDDNDFAVLLGSMYLTDAPLVYLDNLVSNPKSTKEQREKAIKLLFDVFVLRAKAEDKIWWSAHSKNVSLDAMAKQFKQTMSEENHFWFAGEV